MAVLYVSGALIDDFRIVKTERTLNVLNAPSPAATASLAIGNEIVAELETLLSATDQRRSIAAVGRNSPE